jgi:hypothetical protein
MNSVQRRRNWFQGVRLARAAAAGTAMLEAAWRLMVRPAWIGRPGPTLDAGPSLGEIGRMPSGLPRAGPRALVAPGLLVALALAQIAAWQGFGLSPWKGGGFGMFATNDHGAFRSVRVVELFAGGERAVALPGDLDRLRRHAREVPREANLRRLAEALRARAPSLGALRVEVWRTEFERGDLSPRLALVARAEVR